MPAAIRFGALRTPYLVRHRPSKQIVSTAATQAGRLLQYNCVVEVDQEAVIGSLIVSGVGIALMRDDIALEKEVAGELCAWRDIRIASTLWFIYLREREGDPVILSLLEVEKKVWG